MKTCGRCSRRLDERDPEVRYHIEGWVRPRKRGVHGVELANIDKEQILCGLCISELKAGSPDQLSMR